MIKYPIINGRYVEQKNCDYCGRTIYIREPYKHMVHRFKSYIRAKDYFKIMNPLRVRVIDVYGADNSHNDICIDCMNNKSNIQGSDIEIIENTERCFYTNDPKSILNTGQIY